MRAVGPWGYLSSPLHTDFTVAPGPLWGSGGQARGGEPLAYRGQGLEQGVEGGVPEAPQAGEGGQEPQEEVGGGDEGCTAQHPVEARPR